MVTVLNVRKAILELILALTGNQWRSARFCMVLDRVSESSTIRASEVCLS